MRKVPLLLLLLSLFLTSAFSLRLLNDERHQQQRQLRECQQLCERQQPFQKQQQCRQRCMQDEYMRQQQQERGRGISEYDDDEEGLDLVDLVNPRRGDPRQQQFEQCRRQCQQKRGRQSEKRQCMQRCERKLEEEEELDQDEMMMNPRGRRQTSFDPEERYEECRSRCDLLRMEKRECLRRCEMQMEREMERERGQGRSLYYDLEAEGEESENRRGYRECQRRCQREGGRQQQFQCERRCLREQEKDHIVSDVEEIDNPRGGRRDPERRYEECQRRCQKRQGERDQGEQWQCLKRCQEEYQEEQEEHRGGRHRGRSSEGRGYGIHDVNMDDDQNPSIRRDPEQRYQKCQRSCQQRREGQRECQVRCREGFEQQREGERGSRGRGRRDLIAALVELASFLN